MLFWLMGLPEQVQMLIENKCALSLSFICYVIANFCDLLLLIEQTEWKAWSYASEGRLLASFLIPESLVHFLWETVQDFLNYQVWILYLVGLSPKITLKFYNIGFYKDVNRNMPWCSFVQSCFRPWCIIFLRL